LSNGRVGAMRGVGSVVRRATDGGTGEERSTIRQALSSRTAGGGAFDLVQQMRTFLHVSDRCAIAVEMIDLVDELRRVFLHVRGLPVPMGIDVCRRWPANLNRKPLWRKLPTICAPSC
jgi:hypothetical protein